MNKIIKLYPLTLALGLLLLNFDFFKQVPYSDIIGKILLVVSIVLFVLKYYPASK